MDTNLLAGVISLNLIAWILCDVIELQRLKRS